MAMIVELVGIGTDGGATLTAEAAQSIARAELLIGAKRMLDAVPEDGRERFCAYDAQKIADHIAQSTASRAAVLLSGDVGFFSGAKALTEALTGHELHLIPGISSMVYFCAKTAVSWENMPFISLHGTQESIAVHVRSHAQAFFLLGGELDTAAVCRRLCEYGLGGVTVLTGARLGYPDERIFSGTAQELVSCETDRLSVMIVRNPAYCPYLPSCIPDEDFVRGNVPMTKAQVRGITVASLQIAEKAVCWDIGCGTGSVSVEMALRCARGRVWSADRSEEAVQLTHENARRFACDNITVRQGEAPAVLEELPPPDCVFIGGSGGEMEAVFDVIGRKNPSARIAVNAVTLETLTAARDAFAARGCDCSIVQIAVTPVRHIGGYTMLQAQNPVFLVQGVLG